MTAARSRAAVLITGHFHRHRHRARLRSPAGWLPQSSARTAASKFAVEALTDARRGVVQPWGVDGAPTEPGAVATPIWQKGRAAALALRQARTPDAEVLYAGALSAVERAASRSALQAIRPTRSSGAWPTPPRRRGPGPAISWGRRRGYRRSSPASPTGCATASSRAPSAPVRAPRRG